MRKKARFKSTLKKSIAALAMCMLPSVAQAATNWTNADNMENELKQNSTWTGSGWLLNQGNYTATDTSNGSLNLLNMNLSLGDGTTLNATGNGVYGIRLDQGLFAMTGGNINAIGNFGFGIRLNQGSFTMTGGNINATGNSGSGIYLDQGSFAMTGGNINAIGNGGFGIYLDQGSFAMTGGNINATGNTGSGISLDQGSFTMTGGNVNATGNTGSGISLDQGSFTMTGGELNLMAGSGNSVYLNNWGTAPGDGNATASIKNSTVRAEFDLAGTYRGYFSANNAPINITNSKFQPLLKNSLSLNKNATKTYTFMDTNSGTITGEFDLIGSVTMNHEIINTGTSYTFSTTRKAWASELLSGNGEIIAKYIEDNASTLNTQNLDLYNLYSTLDMSPTRKDLTAVSNSLTPHMSTKLSGVALNKISLANKFQDAQVDSIARLSMGNNFNAESNDWQIWASPIMQKPNGKLSDSSQTPDEKSAGLILGMTKSTDKNTKDFSVYYINSNLDMRYASANLDTFGINYANRQNINEDNVFLKYNAGYAFTDVEQDRYPGGTFNNKSNTDLHALRLGLGIGKDNYLKNARVTPFLGLDYTYTYQKGYTESGNLSTAYSVGSESHNSLRTKLGVETELNINSKTSIDFGAYWRYELLSKKAQVEANFMSMPNTKFTFKDDDRSRSSIDLNLGLNFKVHKQTDLKIGFGYELNSGADSQYLNLQLLHKF